MSRNKKRKQIYIECDEACCTPPEIIYEKSVQCIPEEIQKQLQVLHMCKCRSESESKSQQDLLLCFPKKLLNSNHSRTLTDCQNCHPQKNFAKISVSCGVPDDICSCPPCCSRRASSRRQARTRMIPPGYVSLQAPAESAKNICSCLSSVCEQLKKQPMAIFVIFLIIIFFTSR